MVVTAQIKNQTYYIEETIIMKSVSTQEINKFLENYIENIKKVPQKCPKILNTYDEDCVFPKDEFTNLENPEKFIIENNDPTYINLKDKYSQLEKLMTIASYFYYIGEPSNISKDHLYNLDRFSVLLNKIHFPTRGKKKNLEMAMSFSEFLKKERKECNHGIKNSEKEFLKHVELLIPSRGRKISVMKTLHFTQDAENLKFNEILDIISKNMENLKVIKFHYIPNFTHKETRDFMKFVNEQKVFYVKFLGMPDEYESLIKKLQDKEFEDYYTGISNVLIFGTYPF